MAQFLNDTFTDTNGTNLTAHTGETGATWSAISGFSIAATIQTNRLLPSGTTAAKSTGTPATADYYVTGRLVFWAVGGGFYGVLARVSNTGTFYVMYTSGSGIALNRSFAAGLASGSFSPSSGASYDMTIECSGTTINGYVQRLSDSQWLKNDGTWQSTKIVCLTATDSNISAAGVAGVYATAATEGSSGSAWDQFSATDGAFTGGGATQLTLTGPTSGTVNVASTNFTVTPDGIVSSDTVTPHSSGSGTFSPTTLTFSGSSSAQTFTYTPTSTSGSPHAISITDSASLTISGSPINYTVNPAPVTIAVNDVNVIFPQGGWLVSGSTYAKTASAGNVAIVGFTGSTSISVTVDVSSQIAASLLSSQYPTIRASIDWGTPVDIALTSSSATISLFTGMTTGAHTLRLWVKNTDTVSSADAWTTPANVVKITSFTIDGTGSSNPPTVLGKRMLCFGDSTSVFSFDNSNNALFCHPQFVAFARGCELAMAGYSGQGYSVAGIGNVPPVYTNGDATNTAFDKLWAGQSRSFTGIDEILITHGTNDRSANQTTLATLISQFLTALRADAPSAKIWVCVPAAGYARTGITNGFNSYQTATPDSNCKLIDLGTSFQVPFAIGAAGEWMHDILHMNNLGQSAYSAGITSAISATGTSSGGSIRLINGGLVAA